MTSTQSTPRISERISPTSTSALSFVVMDCPDDNSLVLYIPLLQQQGVKHVIRISDIINNNYDTKQMTNVGICVHDDIKFEDGSVPDKSLVEIWILFLQRLLAEECDTATGKCPTVAVHCVSGIGRAPLLVAIACVESGVDALVTIDLIRKHRRGALNTRQVRWLSDYKCKQRLLPVKKSGFLARTLSKLTSRGSRESVRNATLTPHQT